VKYRVQRCIGLVFAQYSVQWLTPCVFGFDNID
jgi:hypothetical protein